MKRMPSSSVRSTSVRNPRMVRVTGATMISFSRSMTSSRVSSRTGGRLLGRRNVPSDLRPESMERFPAVGFPRERFVVA